MAAADSRYWTFAIKIVISPKQDGTNGWENKPKVNHNKINVPKYTFYCNSVSIPYQDGVAYKDSPLLHIIITKSKSCTKMRNLPGDNLALIRGLWCTIMSCKWGNFIEFYRLSGIYFPDIAAADDVSVAAYFLMAGGICQYGFSPFCFSAELLAKWGISYEQNVNFHSIYTACFFFSKSDD